MKKISVFIIFVFFYINILNCSELLTLNQAVKVALKNNYLIKSKKHEIDSYKFFYKSKRSLRFPSFYVNSTYTNLDKDKKININTPLYKSSLTQTEKDYINIQSGAKLNLFTGGAIDSKIKMAESNMFSEKYSLEEVKLNIIENVKLSYLNILMVKALKKISEKEVDFLKAHLKDTKVFYEQGVVAYIDVLQTQVELSKSLQNLNKIKNQLKIAKAKLNITMGRDINIKYKIEDISYPIKLAHNENFFIKYAIKHRPIIKKIGEEINYAKYSKNLAKSQLFPKVYLNGGYKYTDINEDIDNKGSYYMQIGLKFNLDWDKPIQEMNAAKSKQLAYQNLLKDIESQISLEIKNAYENYLTALENYKVAQKNKQQAEEYYRIIKEKYKQQFATNTELMDAQHYLTSANMSMIISYYEVLSSIVKLERASTYEILDN